MNFSLQLWSVKDDIAKDYFGTLEAIAKMGYKGVELAGYGDIPAVEMKAKLDELGLIATGTHISMDRMRDNLAEEIEYNKTVGNEYLICPFAHLDTPEQLDELVEVLNNATTEAAKHGLKVGYHNHDFEFKKFDGEYILDLIAARCPDIILELDMCWVVYAGLDPVEYIEKCGARAELIHLKQLNSDRKQCDFPEGTIDMFAIIEAAKFAKHFVIEQETWEELPAMESARRNIEFMLKK